MIGGSSGSGSNRPGNGSKARPQSAKVRQASELLPPGQGGGFGGSHGARNLQRPQSAQVRPASAGMSNTGSSMPGGNRPKSPQRIVGNNRPPDMPRVASHLGGPAPKKDSWKTVGGTNLLLCNIVFNSCI